MDINQLMQALRNAVPQETLGLHLVYTQMIQQMQQQQAATEQPSVLGTLGKVVRPGLRYGRGHH